MKKLFFLIVFTLASCAAPAETLPTATATLPSTATVIPTPTTTPAFLAMQETIAKTDNYTIMGNGEIEGKLPDGTIGVIPGIRLNPDGKGYTIMVDGQAVTISADDVSISDKDGIKIKGYKDVAQGAWVEVDTFSSNGFLTEAPMWYEIKDVEKYKSVETKPMVIGGVETMAVVADGVVIAADMNKDKKFERVSEYKDADGNVFYSYINMDVGMGTSQAFQLEPGASAILVERLFKELSEGQFKGMTPEQIKNQMILDAATGKKTKIWTATSPDVVTEQNKYDTEWEEIEVDVTKPWEIILIGSEQQYNEMPEDWQSEMTDFTSEPGLKADGIMKVGRDGHIILIGVDTQTVNIAWLGFNVEKLNQVIQSGGNSKKGMQKIASSMSGRLLLFGLSRLSVYRQNNAMVIYPSDSDGRGVVKAFSDTWWDSQEEAK
ncbi:MAG: hypothetical protein HY864_15675 [Chloroflexi bacterium]|nr:hypothetical protein [Chloroflexota bacterium]